MIRLSQRLVHKMGASQDDLAEMKSLTSLELDRTKVTNAAVIRLAKKLPECSVVK